DAENERCRRREVEQPPGLVERVARLDDDGARDAVLAQERLELLGPEAPPERGGLARQPRRVGRRRIPEMPVGVNHPAPRATQPGGDGAPGGAPTFFELGY